MEERVLLDGLTALSRAGMARSPYLGHFGSALLAAYFMHHELELSRDTVRAIGNTARRLIASEPGLFQDLPAEPVDHSLARNLEGHLAQHADTLSRSGHATIVGMYALKALRLRPDAITHARIGGIIALCESYGVERDTPRYYGHGHAYQQQHRDGVADAGELRGARDAFGVAIQETAILFADMYIDGDKYYFMGEKLHAITHAHAIWELHRLGYHTIANQAQHAQDLQLRLNRAVPPTPVDRIEGRAVVTPEQPEFWERVHTYREELALPHAFKRSYSLFVAVREGIVNRFDPLLNRLWYVLQL